MPSHLKPDDFDNPEFESFGPAGRKTELMLVLDGYEGPIDALLALAREQKVDLLHISILQLANQFLSFVTVLREHDIELAADYLVMAAWLAFLKSRLLLPVPEPEDNEPSGTEMAAALSFHLKRLQAMQDVAANLDERPKLGSGFFARGAPESLKTKVTQEYDGTLFELFKAYGAVRGRNTSKTLSVQAQRLYSVEQALKRLAQILPGMSGWVRLEEFLPVQLKSALDKRSAVSATLVAALELMKQGKLDIKQTGGPFSPIHIKKTEDQ